MNIPPAWILLDDEFDEQVKSFSMLHSLMWQNDVSDGIDSES